MSDSIAPDPLLAEELELEEEMVRLGSIRFNEAYQKMAGKGKLASTDAGLEITAGGLPRVAAKLGEWLQDQWAESKRSGGRRSKAYEALAAMDHSAAAMIALRVVLDQMTAVPTYQRVAIKVGAAIEDEQHFRQTKRDAPELWNWAREKGKDSGHHGYKRTLMVRVGNVGGVVWEGWTEELKLRVGVVMIEMIRQACGILDVATKPSLRSHDTTLYVFANNATLAWIRQYNLECHLLCPVRLPMIVPPRDWTTPFDGGYLSDVMPRPNLVKTSKKAYLRELELCRPTQVYSAVNRLQKTAWKVNRDVLNVLREVWQGREMIAGLPPSEDPPMPAKPIDIDTDARSRRQYRRSAARVWDRIIQLRSRRMQCAQIQSIAERFKDHAAIYFPYQLDFRGRVYTQPSGLQPQGSDLAKGLLMFAEGKPLDSDAAVRWFKIHGANCFGVDKVSFEDRLRWVDENQGMILDVSIDPIHNREWTKAESPFPFLAWCLEFGRWFESPTNFKSHLPVTLDASCSGLQHFSAMLRDSTGAASTNLLPSDSPRDIYGEVAKVALKLLEEDAYSPTPLVPPRKDGKAGCDWTRGLTAQMWLAYGVDRKVCKRPVMTMPYGSTLFSCKTFVMNAVEEREEEGVSHPFGEHLIEASGYLAQIIWTAIGRVVVAAREAMDWLQASARIAAKEGLPVSWRVPSGFPVLQAYPEMESRRVKLSLGESILQISIQSEKPLLDKVRQRSGISPNFVHSCDASALTLAVNRAGEGGLKDFCCVHDSFGTHASSTDTLVQSIRGTFVEMYSAHDVLAEFKAEVEGLGVTLPPLPNRGTLDLRQILESRYCFA